MRRPFDQETSDERERPSLTHRSAGCVAFWRFPGQAMLDRSSSSPKEPVFSEFLVAGIEKLIGAHPTYGYRRIWRLLCFQEGLSVNKKAVYRILKP